MALRRNTAFGQTDNAVITMANSDDFGEAGFDFVPAGQTTVTADNEHTLPGQSMAFKVSPASGAAAMVQFGGSAGNLTSTDIAIDAWFYRTANPVAEHTIINATNTAGTRRLNINLETAGKLKVRDEGSAYLYTFTNPIPLNAWYRVRIYSRNQGAAASLLKVALVNASGTVVEEYSTTTATRTEPIAGVAFGKTGTDTSTTSSVGSAPG